jgi:uncharacterized protein YpmS
MSVYFLGLIAIIVISILVILYVRISARNSSSQESEDKIKDGADFTILE